MFDVLKTRRRIALGHEDEPRSALIRFVLTTPGLVVARLGLLAIILICWELASGTLVSKFWISAPSAVYAMLKVWIVRGSLWPHVGATLLAMVLGYVIGCASGIGVGLLLGFFPKAQRVLAPYLSALYSMPKIALAPLFVIMLGIGIESKVALVSVTVFFLLLYNTVDGVRDVDADLVSVMKLAGATRMEICLKLLVPASLPWIFTGMRIAVRYALTAAILGELIAANQGVGFLVEYYAGQFNSTGVFAAVIVLVVCSVLLTELLTRVELSTSRGRA